VEDAFMRKILYISGTRADYGPARSVLKAIQADPDLDLKILVTGMHLDPIHGETWREIEADGFSIAEYVYGRVTGDSLAAMGASVGLYLYGMSHAIARIKPDIMLVLGDRGEQLAGAMAAAFQNIVVVHLCGGSISGSIDDSIRHAITKFAHYHLPAFKEHAERIIQMGEDPKTVRVVGLPGGDIRPDVKFIREEVCSDLNLPLDDPYLLVVQHAVTHSQNEAGKQIIETLEAVGGLNYPTLLANPNDDAGGRVILKKMREYAEKNTHLHVLPPPRSRERFASIMAHAGALIGNSSSGIVEAMSVGLPVVNIGDRQRGREHHACLINVEHNRAAIQQAIEEALRNPDYQDRLKTYTSRMINKTTTKKIVAYLKEIDLDLAKAPKTFYECI
jgi:UDP-N-acetylglucosamine 2-epimerase (non-hydrolysing)/GDP/UDP-N,N'-diacetylbacillosamine 2-epimerase (hydrolysing)